VGASIVLAGCATTVQAISEPTSSIGPATDSPATQEALTPDPEKATIQGSWSFDVSDAGEVIRDADVVLVARVTAIDAMATFEFAKGGTPKTGVTVETISVLKGEAPTGDRLFVPGGTVTLQQVFESDFADSTEKNGIAAKPEKERRATTVHYVSAEPVRLVTGEEYLFMLRHPAEPNYFVVAADGYGVFEKTSEGFYNSITKRTLTINEIETLIREP
jgi:hypothetical protein